MCVFVCIFFVCVCVGFFFLIKHYVLLCLIASLYFTHPGSQLNSSHLKKTPKKTNFSSSYLIINTAVNPISLSAQHFNVYYHAQTAFAGFTNGTLWLVKASVLCHLLEGICPLTRQYEL